MKRIFFVTFLKEAKLISRIFCYINLFLIDYFVR